MPPPTLPRVQPATPGRQRWPLMMGVSLAMSVIVGVTAGVLVSGPAEVRQYVQELLQSWRAPPAVTTSEDVLAVADQQESGHDGDARAAGQTPDHDSDAPHDHDHDHEDGAVELSEQARRSIGLKLGTVALSTFQRTIRVPGTVVERPGRTRQAVIAPLTGQVTQVYCTPGEAVRPGQPLFELRLTHEELVQAQADLLATTEEIDVVKRESARLEELRTDGLIATKRILEQEYELQKLEGRQRAQRQGLILHGLQEEQVDAIVSTRTLLSKITVRVPVVDPAAEAAAFVLQDLRVERGEYVAIGDTLGLLVDHSILLIEGEGFEKDIPGISAAAAAGRPVAAILESGAGKTREVTDLRITYLASAVDSQARTLDFFVTLPNERVASPANEKSRSIAWRFRPGQRVEIIVPVDEWPERIVLPATAVAQDGVENYVFHTDDDHFHQQPVQVEYRDPRWVVIANDGSLELGETVALTAARQLLIALKNQAGGGVDPHAGHHH